ncbi:MAG: hypothetical protein GF411_00585 [Candidatus Lokiarchaeota archaeon]|nr:hypothetical protein [Candidatus Lokiarchaeota archaeon]
MSKDDVIVVPFSDSSGGLISYQKSENAYLHTLGDQIGFIRKLKDLDIEILDN